VSIVAAEQIIEILLKLPPEQRESVFAAVKHNKVFCVHCGYGSRQTPNPRCQCTNDE
jgi:hypothetical protein